MKTSEDRIRELALQAINELGENATEEKVRQLVGQKLATEGVSSKTSDRTGTRVILTTFGINQPGVVSTITSKLSECGCDILDISQKIMQEFYTMIMMIDLTGSTKELKDLQEEMNTIAAGLNIKIFLQHEDVFRYMHRI
ncbi:MAG: ACT domain-containing protein [Ignavibacteriaceae bacterium]|nr:ACT domain-containing protein [Ignavibacteriaceae bacterium]